MALDPEQFAGLIKPADDGIEARIDSARLEAGGRCQLPWSSTIAASLRGCLARAASFLRFGREQQGVTLGTAGVVGALPTVSRLDRVGDNRRWDTG